MIWQDVVMSVGVFFFVVCALPLLAKGSQISRWSSIPTAAWLIVFAVVYWTLDMPGTAVLEAAMALVWALVAILRPRKKCAPEA